MLRCTTAFQACVVFMQATFLIPQVSVQAIAMDEDAELAGLSDQSGPKVGAGGAIPAGAMMATPGDQTQRKVPLDRGSDTKQALERPSQEPPLLPHAQSGSYPAQCAHVVQTI